MSDLPVAIEETRKAVDDIVRDIDTERHITIVHTVNGPVNLNQRRFGWPKKFWRNITPRG